MEERPDFYPRGKCSHDYKIIDKNLTVNEIRGDDRLEHLKVDGYVLFHCSKCLDIQKKVIT